MDMSLFLLIHITIFFIMAHPRFFQLGSADIKVIVKTSYTIPGTMMSLAPRLGKRTSSNWFWSIVEGLLVNASWTTFTLKCPEVCGMG